MPKELAKETGIPLSHVSNVLSELIQKNVVVCLTPDLKKGRMYSLTKEGSEVLQYL